MSDAYKKAGVDRDAAHRAVELISKHARSTFRPEVIGDIGFFGGLFQLGRYKEPVLVSSVDGVGTKLKIAALMQRHDTVGMDLVNHCVNDILTCGATPLFFLDYIATGTLVPEQVESLAKGLSEACRAVNCALIGGETAEMPGIYAPGDYDLVGFIVGVVERREILDGSGIAAGDAILGLPSSGLHTNGYSLVRRIFQIERDRKPLEVYFPELGKTLGEALLIPHRCYYTVLKPVLPLIKGMAHITGGGLLENVPRVLPGGLSARFRKGSWPILPIFELIQKRGGVGEREMYRVFNMGLGMVVICSQENVSGLLRALPEARVVGEVMGQKGDERVIIS